MNRIDKTLILCGGLLLLFGLLMVLGEIFLGIPGTPFHIWLLMIIGSVFLITGLTDNSRKEDPARLVFDGLAISASGLISLIMTAIYSALFPDSTDQILWLVFLSVAILVVGLIVTYANRRKWQAMD